MPASAPILEYPPIEVLYAPLPDLTAVPPKLKLTRPRNAYINWQISQAINATHNTKFCSSEKDNAVAWVLCERTSLTVLTYRLFAYWGTTLTPDISPEELQLYELTVHIPDDAEFPKCAEHIRYITIEGDSVTILVNGTSIRIPKKWPYPNRKYCTKPPDPNGPVFYLRTLRNSHPKNIDFYILICYSAILPIFSFSPLPAL